MPFSSTFKASKLSASLPSKREISRGERGFKTRVTMVVFLLITIVLLVGNTKPVAACLSTRIASFSAYYSYGAVFITGTLQYRNATDLTSWIPFGSKITFYWYQQASSIATTTMSNFIGSVWSDSASGVFTYTWFNPALEPGQYLVVGVYAGGDTVQGGNTTCANGNGVGPYGNGTGDDTSLVIALQLTLTLKNPTASVAQGESTSVMLTVTAQNSNNPHPVSLSLQAPGNLFATETFSPSSGSTPLASKLTINVLNTTDPGTYQIRITATSAEYSYITVSAPLQLIVQQDTHDITVAILGLPSAVKTSLLVDGNTIGDFGSMTQTITISNKAKTVSVLKQIASGDTLYACQDYSKAANTGVTSFTFTYDTKYRLKISGDLPQTVVSKLVFVVDGTDKTNSNFKPAQGYNDFLPQNAHVSFAITPTYITGSDVNYKLKEWKDLATGEVMKASNATADGLYQITLTRPYYLAAYYDKWVVVTIKANLPSNMSTRLQIGLIGENRTINLAGSVAYSAGEFLAGSTFGCTVSQGQLVLFNAGGNARYEFQGLTPLSPMTLVKHTTISINYAVKYKIQVISSFADAILQPAGGVGWFASGDIATLQVKGEAKDKNGIPYIFDGWTGAIRSNKTIVSFPVTAPIQVEAQWKLNWTYLLTVGGVFLGVTTPSAIVIKKKIRGWRPIKKKGVPKISEETVTQDPRDADLKLYNYIIERGGSMSISDAMKELGMTKEEVNESIRRLKETQLLR